MPPPICNIKCIRTPICRPGLLPPLLNITRGRSGKLDVKGISLGDMLTHRLAFPLYLQELRRVSDDGWRNGRERIPPVENTIRPFGTGEISYAPRVVSKPHNLPRLHENIRSTAVRRIIGLGRNFALSSFSYNLPLVRIPTMPYFR